MKSKNLYADKLLWLITYFTSGLTVFLKEIIFSTHSMEKISSNLLNNIEKNNVEA